MAKIVAKVGYSGPLSRSRQDKITVKRQAAAATVTLYLSHTTKKYCTATVPLSTVEAAIDRYLDEGYSVTHPGYERTEQYKPKADAKPKELKPGRPGVPVICLNTGAIYASTAEAAESVGAFRQQIIIACNNPGAKCKGHQFRFATEEEVENGYKGELLPVAKMAKKYKRKPKLAW